MKSSKFSLTQKINALALGSLIVLGAVCAFQFQNSNAKIVDGTRDGFFSYAIQLGHTVATEFFERYGDVQAFAVNKAFHSNNTEHITTALNTYVKLYGIYDLIMYVNKQGKLVAVNNRSPEDKELNTSALFKNDYSSESWFKAALNGHYTEDRSSGITGSYFEEPKMDSFVSAVYGGENWTNSFSTQVRDESGNVIGVLTTRANFKWAAHEFEDFYYGLAQNGYTGAEMALLDKKGNIIFEYDPEANNGDKHLKFDLQTLGKFNLAERGVTAAQDLIQGKQGSGFAMNVRKKIEQLVGFSPIKDNKFISSIGWGILIRMPKSVALAGVLSAQRTFYISLAAILVAAIVFSFFFARSIGKQFIAVSEDLSKTVTSTTELSQEMGKTSDSVASSSEEQAAAIQESVSALAEMNSMIAQTVQNSKQSLESARLVTNKTEDGRDIMQKLVSSMESIQQATHQLQNITSIIQEINNKTSIINDIVFKTQLLSFNASIEAARAGQHGRGFAVVAEEVGNLAQLSGNAAKEIQSLLHDSQKQVASTLDMIQVRVKDGNHISDNALRAFNEIATAIESVTVQIKGITDATQQQEAGLQQTSTAMGQMDIASQRNIVAARNASQAATQLESQAHNLKGIMQHVQGLVLGAAVKHIEQFEKKKEDYLIKEPKKTSTAESTKDLAQKLLGKKKTKVETTGEVKADDDSFKPAA